MIPIRRCIAYVLLLVTLTQLLGHTFSYATRGTPEGRIQCYDLSSLSSKDLPVTKGEMREVPRGGYLKTPRAVVDYYLTIPADCKMLQFSAVAAGGQYAFSISKSYEEFNPYTGHEDTLFGSSVVGGSQRYREGFVVRVPLY